MAASIKIWANGVPPNVEDDDLNGFKNENNNLIVGAGIALLTSDSQQTHKAVAHYAGVGDFYVDSGAADAYVLGPTGAQIAPPVYANGMRIRFVAGNVNTGPSTINVAGLGVVPLVRDDTGAALVAGDISINVETRASYDGVSFRVYAVYLINRTLTNPTLTTPTLTTPTLASPVLNTSISGSAFLDEDNMISDSADKVSSQQSIKAYVDAKTAVLNTKVIDIGDWDMDAGPTTLGVAHGVTLAKIRTISVLIRNDADNTYWDFLLSDGSTANNTEIRATSVLINLQKAVGGFFDSTNFDNTPFNRGWITIQYTD